ncbi:14992_t:CDS:2 [Rhizophagus irregularis]|nr:14992_t:CDS:2 [Rhizophagus irregularis]
MTLLNLIRNLNRSSNFNPLLTNFKKQSFNSFNDSKKLLTTLSASHISIKEAIDTLSESSPKEYDEDAGFCTNIKGPKHQFKSNSVGRWKSLDDIKNDNESFDLFDINKFKSISSVPNEFDLPEELKILKNKNINPDLIFLVSDSEPYQFLESLDHHFPTSQPFSLFHNNNIFSRGTIGVALTAESPNEFKNQFQIEHPSLSTIGDPLKITSCRGNIILKLDGTNPTKLLLDKLQFVDDKNFLSKETELYIGLYNSDNKENQLDESTLIVYKISSGDPVKGNLAVDTMMDLKEGQFVKLFYKKNEPDTILLQNKLKDQNDETQIILTMTDQDTMDSTSLLRLNNNKNIFGATSENGIIIGKGKNENTWVCNVPYSTASLLLSK